MNGSSRTRRVACQALTFALLLVGCQGVRPPTESRTPTVISAETPPAAPARCYAVDPDASEVRILVYRDGPLARLGHNHVMVSHGVSGRAAITDPGDAAAVRVRMEVASLDVDPPAARAEEGSDFDSEVSDEARAGTRANLLGERVLNVADHPYIDVELGPIVGPRWAPDAVVRVRLRDVVRDQPVRLGVWTRDDVLHIRGSFPLRQSDFGLEPFSALGGGLRVADELTVRVKLRFARMEAANGTGSNVGSCMEPFHSIQ